MISCFRRPSVGIKSSEFYQQWSDVVNKMRLHPLDAQRLTVGVVTAKNHVERLPRDGVAFVQACFAEFSGLLSFFFQAKIHHALSQVDLLQLRQKTQLRKTAGGINPSHPNRLMRKKRNVAVRRPKNHQWGEIGKPAENWWFGKIHFIDPENYFDSYKFCSWELWLLKLSWSLARVMIGYHSLIRYSVSNHKPHPILRDVCGLNHSLLLGRFLGLPCFARFTTLLQCGAPLCQS